MQSAPPFAVLLYSATEDLDATNVKPFPHYPRLKETYLTAMEHHQPQLITHLTHQVTNTGERTLP